MAPGQIVRQCQALEVCKFWISGSSSSSSLYLECNFYLKRSQNSQMRCRRNDSRCKNETYGKTKMSITRRVENDYYERIWGCAARVCVSNWCRRTDSSSCVWTMRPLEIISLFPRPTQGGEIRLKDEERWAPANILSSSSVESSAARRVTFQLPLVRIWPGGESLGLDWENLLGSRKIAGASLEEDNCEDWVPNFCLKTNKTLKGLW